MALGTLLLTGCGCLWVLVSIRCLPSRLRNRLFLRQLFALQLLDLIGALGFSLRLLVEGGTILASASVSQEAGDAFCRGTSLLIDVGTETSGLMEINLALGFAFCAKPYLRGLRILRRLLPLTVLFGVALCVLGPMTGTMIRAEPGLNGGVHCHMEDHWWWHLATWLLCGDVAACTGIYVVMCCRSKSYYHGATAQAQALLRGAVYLPVSVLLLTPAVYVCLIHNYPAGGPSQILAIFCLHMGGFGNTIIYAWQSKELRRRAALFEQEGGENLARHQNGTSATSCRSVDFSGATIEVVEVESDIDEAEAEAMFWFTSCVEDQVGEMARREREESGRLAWPSS
mmetsp:Transcript_15015/g.26495  ORF Transcript_15015/g.26495 Transcript_15015/m.26495 type:complete len:342 (-) Transcript_15015:111-1136(-)